MRLFKTSIGIAHAAAVLIMTDAVAASLPVPQAGVSEPVNVARGRPVRADSERTKETPAALAVDGGAADVSRWLSAETAGPHWMEVDLGGARTVGGAHLYSGWQCESVVRSFELQAWDGAQWTTIPGTKEAENSLAEVALPFAKPVKTEKIRLWINDDGSARIAELLLWESPGALPPLGFGVTSRQSTLPKLPGWMDADTSVKVLVSQYGFNPEHPKIVHYKGEADTFLVKRSDDGTTVHTGRLAAAEGDFGKFMQGDFTAFRTTGEYYIQIGDDRSPGSFRIAPNLWDNLQKLTAWHYFGLRRMGEDNVMGNLGDFRLVNWEHGRIKSEQGDKYKYIGRAWADGEDGRIYPSASLVVAQYCALKESNPFWDKSGWIYAQVRWGLDGTLSFLEKDGILRLMLGAWPEHQTMTYDNRFHSGDEKLLDDCFNQSHTCNEYSKTENHEVVYSSLLIGPAYAVCLFRDKDPEFFGRVEKLVKAGYDTIYARYNPYPQKYSLASWAWLNLLMWRMTGEVVYRDRAVAEADRLMQLQQRQWVGGEKLKARGWFRYDTAGTKNPWGEKPEQEVMITPWIYQVFFKLIEYMPAHPQAKEWKASIRSYASDYLASIAKMNPFGYTPMKVAASDKCALKRANGDLSYQYFASIGRHFHQLGNAAFMLQAARLLDDPALADAAWRQTFWFAGDNPSGFGLIHGLGANNNSTQTDVYWKTLGRVFPGGMSNGAISDKQDNPDFCKYNEYYTYANLNVLWLSTSIGARKFENAIELWPKEIAESPHTVKPDKHPRDPFPVRFKGGFTYAFMAVVRDDPANAVRWLVDGVEGGNPKKGTITAGGVYTAPYVTAETTVTVTALSRKDKAVKDQTAVTIMPVPRKVKNLRCSIVKGKAELSWSAIDGNAVGYTVWRRLPSAPGRVGTIFEMVGSTELGKTSYTYPNDTIRYYDDNLPLAGTEFMVKAYNMKVDNNFQYGKGAGWIQTQHKSPDKIYGFGPDSDIVRIMK